MSYSVMIRSRTPKCSKQSNQIISESDKCYDGDKIGQKSVWSVYVVGALHLSDWGESLGGDIELRPEC